MNEKLINTILKVVITCIIITLFVLYAKKFLSTLPFVVLIALTFIAFEIIKMQINKRKTN